MKQGEPRWRPSRSAQRAAGIGTDESAVERCSRDHSATRSVVVVASSAGGFARSTKRPLPRSPLASNRYIRRL